MARTDITSVTQEGRWSGLNETSDPRQIAPNELADCSNIVVRDGKVAPRAGYEKATETQFSASSRLLISGVTDILYCAYDATNSRLYYTINGSTNKVQYIPANGGTAVDVVTGSLNAPFGIALDVAGGVGFATETGSLEITKFDIPGPDTNITLLYTESSGVPRGIDVDLINTPDTLYWANFGVGIRKAPVTPGSASTILAESVTANANAPGRAHSVAVDGTNSHVYYSADTNSNNKGHIGRVDMDGSNPTRLVEVGDRRPADLSLDLTNNKIYWIEWPLSGLGYIRRADLAGTNEEILLVLPAPANRGGIAVDPANSLFYYTLFALGTAYRSAISSTNSKIVSSFWFRRNLLDVDASTSEFSKDIVLLQVLDDSAGTSNLVAWFPSTGNTFSLNMGFTLGSGTTPSTFVTNNRDTDPASGSAFSTMSNRMSYAWTGAGIDSGQGGAIMCNGDTSSVHNPYVFNYVMGDTIQTLTMTGGPTGGTFRVGFEGVWGGNVAWNATPNDVSSAFEDFASIDSVVVTQLTGLPNFVYQIRFVGSWSGKSANVITIDNIGLTGGSSPAVAAAITQAGGTDTDSIIYVRPAGLPTPAAPTISSGSAGDLDGTYKYKISYYSSTWGLEGPLSPESNEVSSQVRMTITPPAVPGTIYFQSDTAIQPRREMVDQYRVYRKRTGDFSAAAVGVWSGYRFVASFGIGDALNDPFSDTVVKANDTAPITSYPPADAQYVTIHEDRAVYASARDRFIWISELPHNKLFNAGELGHEQVSDLSFESITNFDADDSGFTGIRSFDGKLYAFTSERVFGLIMDSNGSIAFSKALPGAEGAASHWCITEARRLKDDPGFLMWASPRGHIYAFNGSTTDRISKKLRATPNSLIRKYWNDISFFDPGLDNSWYWSSLVLDTENNRIILATFDTASNDVQVVYSLDDGAWTKWDIPSHGWMVGREWNTSASVAQGRDLILFGGPNSILFKMTEGKGDNGSAFSWNYKTARFSVGRMTKKRLFYSGEFLWDRRSFGTDATVAVQPILEDASLTSSGTLTLSSGDTGSVKVTGSGRDVQFLVSGTTADGQDHPELVAFGMDVKSGERSAGRQV